MLDLLQEQQKKISLCQTCRGLGWKPDGRGKSIKCDCLRDAEYELLLDQSGIPSKFKPLLFKDYMYQNSKTFESIWKYIHKAALAVEHGQGLFLWGPQYTGKSMLACCILKELMKKGYSCGFVTFSGLMGDVKGADKYLNKVNTFSCIDSITDVLDRLVNFTEGALTKEPNNGAVNLLIDVLSARQLRNQPTILTSKVSIKTIRGDSRFTSLGAVLDSHCFEVECGTSDFRARAKERLNTEFGFDEVQ